MGSGKSHGHSSNKDQTPAEKRTLRDVETTQESAQQVPPCFPPDEPPVLTKILSNGQVRSFAGTVTLVHVPSLPLRKPSRFPLDDPMLKAPTERIGDTKPQLHGLGTIHPGLIERNNPPPITGWAVDVPLDDDDMKYESRPTSRVGDTMQIDDVVVNTRSSNDKEDSEELIKVRLQTAALGMDGKVIVVVGTRGRIWVYRMKSGHKTYQTTSTAEHIRLHQNGNETHIKKDYNHLTYASSLIQVGYRVWTAQRLCLSSYFSSLPRVR